MSPPRPILPHMPDHIKKRIMDLSNTNSKLSLRQCSKSFNLRFSESWTEYDYLMFQWNCDNENIRIKFKICEKNEKEVVFHDFQEGYLVEFIHDHGNSQKIVENGSFIDAAVEQLLKIFKKRKVILKVLRIDFQDFYFQENRFKRHRNQLIEKLINVLTSLNHTIHVKHLAMHIDQNATDISRILPFFEPGVLENIELSPQRPHSSRYTNGTFNLSSIIGMEQWRRAVNFWGKSYNLTLDHEDTKHFEGYEVFGRLELESFKKILQNLHLHSNWKFRSIRCHDFDFAALSQHLSVTCPISQPSSYSGLHLEFRIPNFCILQVIRNQGIRIFRVNE